MSETILAPTDSQLAYIADLCAKQAPQTHAFLCLASEIRALAVLLDHALTKAARAD